MHISTHFHVLIVVEFELMELIFLVDFGISYKVLSWGFSCVIDAWLFLISCVILCENKVAHASPAIWSSSNFLMQFILPHILGWDRYINQSAKNTQESASMVDPRVKDLEWDRWIAFCITPGIYVYWSSVLNCIIGIWGCSTWEPFSCDFALRSNHSVKRLPLKFKCMSSSPLIPCHATDILYKRSCL